MRCPGRSLEDENVFRWSGPTPLSKSGDSSSSAGGNGVAITNRRARISTSATVTVLHASTSHAPERNERPARRSAGGNPAVAAAAITSRHDDGGGRRFDPGVAGSRPNSPARADSLGASGRRRTAIDGTQPVLRQSPPILRRSTSTVGTPKAAVAAATNHPPGTTTIPTNVG